jgi:hypothetical protein
MSPALASAAQGTFLNAGPGESPLPNCGGEARRNEAGTRAEGRRARLVACLALALCAQPEARQHGPATGPHSVAAFRARPATKPPSPPAQPPGVSFARAALPRCGTRRTTSSGRLYSGDSSGMREKASLPRTYGNSSSFRLFLIVPRGKRARGVRERPLKKRPSILASLQVGVPVAPST